MKYHSYVYFILVRSIDYGRVLLTIVSLGLAKKYGSSYPGRKDRLRLRWLKRKKRMAEGKWDQAQVSSFDLYYENRFIVYM